MALVALATHDGRQAIHGLHGNSQKHGRRVATLDSSLQGFTDSQRRYATPEIIPIFSTRR